MKWLGKSFRDIYWSLRHILGFWPVVIVKVIAKSLRLILVVSLVLGIFHLVKTNFDLTGFPQVLLPVLTTASAIIVGTLLLHEPAREYFSLKKEARRQNWNDVQISLRKYPKGHPFHGVVIIIRNFKWHPIKDLIANVVAVEQNGAPQSGTTLAQTQRLPQALDRAYVWESAELPTEGGTVELVLVHLADGSETYGNIPNDGKTHESQAFIEIKAEKGDGLIRVELNGISGGLKMSPKVIEYPIQWRDGKLAMKTESRLARWFRNGFQPFH
jgi:hypothetical protein